MKKDKRSLAYGYVRLSKDDVRDGSPVRLPSSEASESIVNQIRIIELYCSQNEIVLLKVFSDDGWSGGNFDRPGFQEMMKAFESGEANLIITKDLSRLGRDMAEASYYAEKFFPEHGIRFVAIADGFDSERENVMAPFQFAMNEVYLRDSSKKIREVFRMKREKGEYCCCPPYGYIKDPKDKSKLIPDERTADIVKLIFEYAAEGRAANWIAAKLTEDGIQTPMQNKIMYHSNSAPEDYAKANAEWKRITIVRTLRNRVYLGDTVLGKTKKINFKSTKKIKIDESEWFVTEGTHEPLVSEELFDLASANIGKKALLYSKKHFRTNIFGGIGYCAECGQPLYCHCSSGGQYAYLVCSTVHSDSENKCKTRISYEQVIDIVKNELNQLISLRDEEIDALVKSATEGNNKDRETQEQILRVQKAKTRLGVIEKTVLKLYTDSAGGNLSDERLHDMVRALDEEAETLKKTIELFDKGLMTDKEIEARYRKFFNRIKNHNFIEELDRNTLVTFVERITIGKKIYNNNYRYNHNRRSNPYTQSIHIQYKFAGAINEIPDVTEKDRLPIKR